MSEVIFSVENLHVSIGRKEVVRDMSFDIKSGEIVGLLGPNGAGKTTTIKAMAGLIKKSRGIIRCCGKNIDEDFTNYIRQIGFGFDRANFYSNISGMDNLKLLVSAYRKYSDEELNECVSEVGLSKRINDKVASYSFGMRQRLNFAKSILTAAKLVVLDEPFNGIDPEGIAEVRKLIKNLSKERKMSFLISSHILSEMQQISDQLLFCKSGRIVGEYNVHQDNVFEQSITVRNPDDKFVKTMFTDEMCIDFISKDTIKFSTQNVDLDTVLHIIHEKGYSVLSVNSKNVLEDLYIRTVGGDQIE